MLLVPIYKEVHQSVYLEGSVESPMDCLPSDGAGKVGSDQPCTYVARFSTVGLAIRLWIVV